MAPGETPERGSFTECVVVEKVIRSIPIQIVEHIQDDTLEMGVQ